MKTKAPVSTEKYIAFNNHILLYSFSAGFGLLLVSFGLWADENVFIVFGVFIACIFIIVSLISPTYYIFSNEKVVICHPFKRRETICWDDIRRIKRYRSWYNRSGIRYNHYKIYYRHEKEVPFLNGEICRSKRTKKLLQKYYKGNVE